jgi:uncharacterized cupin superfamily protein
MADAVVLGAGEGEALGGAATVTIKVGGAQTGGSIYIGESVVPPGFPGPPPHFHERMHDMFYVLEGTLTMRVGDETVELSAGGFACAPPGVVHTFSNRSSAPVRFLNLATPAGFEDYMRELSAVMAKASPTSEEIGAIASRYDFKAV